MSAFSLATVVIYTVLAILWGLILVLYLWALRHSARQDRLVSILVGVLALDAFKSCIENVYFGTLWSSTYGYLPARVSRVLSDPVPLTMPKVLNLFVALAVLGVLVRRWIPEQLREREAHRAAEHRLRGELEASLAEVRTREAQLRGFTENTADLFFLVETAGGTFQAANPAFETTTGLRVSDLLGRRPGAILPDRTGTYLETQFSIAASRTTNTFFETTLAFPHGSLILQAQLVPIRDEAGQVVLLAGIARDLTEPRRREEAQLQAQKLESLGLLAGGIAHDFNNLLTAILGYVSMAQSATQEGRVPSRKGIDAIESTALRAAELTRQLLVYSGQGSLAKKPLDLNHTVEEIGRLLSVSISKRVRVLYHLHPELPRFEGDPGQIQQVVMNLVTNASDAIGEREGSVTISTGLVELGELDLLGLHTGRDLVPGPHVALTVADTGCGMPPEVMARIYDPFFSTKGEGRGLGLSAMLGILRSHGAGLLLWSEPGQGTSFTVLFKPCDALAEGPQPCVPSRDVRYEGTALVVDDEEVIRETSASILESLGFQVLTASDGVEAVDCFTRHRERIRFVLLDLTMPRLGGRETFLAMHALAPAVPVVISSGYNPGQQLDDLAAQGLAGFLPKPYRLADLARTVAEALQPRG
jgi:PAS domain S-box-containing protein